ncbi:MAG: VOC family protein [Solirubrobacteraceae bacterium]
MARGYGCGVGFEVQGIDHVALRVGDQEASKAWYRDVLGLKRAFADPDGLRLEPTTYEV